jgi:5-methylcytosine-specific restriction endonuclease McrA
MGSFVSVQKVAAKKIGMTYEEYLVKIVNEKWCCKCKSWQSRSFFNIDNSRGDKLYTKCHSCMRVKVKKCWKGRISTFKGRTHSEESKQKMSAALKGLPSAMKGKNHSLETKQKISNILRVNSKKGIESKTYKHGKTQQLHGDRFTKEYKRWRFDVMIRDKFVCQKCGCCIKKELTAHHIKQFSKFPELRFDVDNGLTVCKGCHKKEHPAKHPRRIKKSLL